MRGKLATQTRHVLFHVHARESLVAVRCGNMHMAPFFICFKRTIKKKGPHIAVHLGAAICCYDVLVQSRDTKSIHSFERCELWRQHFTNSPRCSTAGERLDRTIVHTRLTFKAIKPFLRRWSSRCCSSLRSASATRCR